MNCTLLQSTGYLFPGTSVEFYRLQGYEVHSLYLAVLLIAAQFN